MKGFLTIDEWLLSQYQKAADWCYSEWDVSPYAVSAQLFGVAAIFGVILYCMGVPIFLFGIELLTDTVWFWCAVVRDSAWKKKRMPMPLTVADTGLRMLTFTFACAYVVLFIRELLLQELSFRASTYMLRTIVSGSAFYFYACNPPTFIERRDRRLVPQT